jgi:hypothetical protein
MESEELPVDPLCVESPEYVVVSLIVPATATVGVYKTLHLLELAEAGFNAHKVELNIPPLPPSLHFIWPVGADFTPVLVSVMIAVKVLADRAPSISEALLGETEAEELRRFTVRTEELWLLK